MKEVDRNNEVNRVLGAFKLNPFEQLGLPFDATQEEAKRQYRKLSLLIHPDKCNHPLATSAFEVLGHANSQLTDEDFMRELRHALNLSRGAQTPTPAVGTQRTPSICALNQQVQKMELFTSPDCMLSETDAAQLVCRGGAEGEEEGDKERRCGPPGERHQ